MNFVGFIKEHGDDTFAQTQEYYLRNQSVNTNKDTLLEYLKKGFLCVAFMGVAEDKDEEIMGKISVYTDGKWFWPDYLIGYLKKYSNFEIEQGFVTHVLANRNRKQELKEKDLEKLEVEFYKICGFK